MLPPLTHTHASPSSSGRTDRQSILPFVILFSKARLPSFFGELLKIWPRFTLFNAIRAWDTAEVRGWLQPSAEKRCDRRRILQHQGQRPWLQWWRRGPSSVSPAPLWYSHTSSLKCCSPPFIYCLSNGAALLDCYLCICGLFCFFCFFLNWCIIYCRREKLWENRVLLHRPTHLLVFPSSILQLYGTKLATIFILAASIYDLITTGVVIEQVKVGKHLFVFHSSSLLLPHPSSCCQPHQGRQLRIFFTRYAVKKVHSLSQTKNGVTLSATVLAENFCFWLSIGMILGCVCLCAGGGGVHCCTQASVISISSKLLWNFLIEGSKFHRNLEKKKKTYWFEISV